MGDLHLSAVVPCYLAEPYIRTCMDSVLAYGGAALEVIAVDDGSPDSCAEILRSYAARDPRVRVVALAASGGLGAARNAGLAAASGDYVWFVDADDWLPASAIEKVLDRVALVESDVLMLDHVDVFGATHVSRRASVFVGDTTFPVRLSDQPALLRLAQSACTKVVRREFLNASGLRFPDGWYEDAFFGRAILLAADRIDVLDEVAYCYRRQNPGSITNTSSARHVEVFEQYRRLWEFAVDADDAVRGELFRAMIDHYLVILGHRYRLPGGARRDFFHRVVSEFRHWRPGTGFRFPGGLHGVKYHLVRMGAYPAYAVTRLVYRAMRPEPVRQASGTGSPA